MHLRSYLFLCLLTTGLFAYADSQPSSCASNSDSYAAILGWESTPLSPHDQCGGHYLEPETIRAYPNPLSISDMPLNITSTGTATYSLYSNSVLEGDVTLTQPGREIRADKATLIPNKTTGEIEWLHLEGHVRYQEAGKLITGKTADIDLSKKTLTVNQTVYHLVQPLQKGATDIWGIAEEAHRISPTFSWFTQATYSTCPPNQTPSWHLKAKHLTLDKIKGRGKAKQLVLYAKSTPIFYLPYFSFPIDKKRYSGFLYPTFGYDSDSGAFLSLPYYFNLAPNYDDTLTVTPMSRRGVLFNNQFRYLTKQHFGTLELGLLPSDQAFSHFKTTQFQMYGSNPAYAPYTDALNLASKNRWNIHFKDTMNFSQNWSGLVDINRVSDDYYFQDLGNNPSTVTTNQLLNQAVITYQKEQWQFSGRLQAWQTLHPINQIFNVDQYERLPELNFSGFWPNDATELNYGLESQWVYFQHAHDFFSNVPYPTGNRFHIAPQVSWPLQNGAGFLTPKVTWDTTLYAVQDNAVVNMNTSPPTLIPNSDPTLNKIRSLPLISLDTGLYFDREFQLNAHPYRQTLEPRLFYLWVPAVHQNNIPIFDTILPPFSFDELFLNNRFMGYDRVGDANQISMALTSHVLDSHTGEEKINASIGTIYYLRRHTVCLYPDCSDDPTIQDRISPLAAQLTYYVNPKVSLIGNAAWDPNQHEINNDSLKLRYFPGERQVINLGYDYIKRGDILSPADINGSENNLHRVNISFSWPLPHTVHWNVLGNLNYNISHSHPQDYLYGLEYENCCWAIRLVSSRVLQTENIAGNVSFQNAYYVQFMLKGLGSVGNTGDGSLLSNAIPGYLDHFKS